MMIYAARLNMDWQYLVENGATIQICNYNNQQ